MFKTVDFKGYRHVVIRLPRWLVKPDITPLPIIRCTPVQGKQFADMCRTYLNREPESIKLIKQWIAKTYEDLKIQQAAAVGGKLFQGGE